MKMKMNPITAMMRTKINPITVSAAVCVANCLCYFLLVIIEQKYSSGAASALGSMLTIETGAATGYAKIVTMPFIGLIYHVYWLLKNMSKISGMLVHILLVPVIFVTLFVACLMGGMMFALLGLLVTGGRF